MELVSFFPYFLPFLPPPSRGFARGAVSGLSFLGCVPLFRFPFRRQFPPPLVLLRLSGVPVFLTFFLCSQLSSSVVRVCFPFSLRAFDFRGPGAAAFFPPLTRPSITGCPPPPLCAPQPLWTPPFFLFSGFLSFLSDWRLGEVVRVADGARALSLWSFFLILRPGFNSSDPVAETSRLQRLCGCGRDLVVAPMFLPKGSGGHRGVFCFLFFTFFSKPDNSCLSLSFFFLGSGTCAGGRARTPPSPGPTQSGFTLGGGWFRSGRVVLPGFFFFFFFNICGPVPRDFQ